jgi:hypothetical protein
VQRKWRSLRPGEKAPDDKDVNCWLKLFKEREALRNRNLQVDQEHRKRMWSSFDSPV